MTFFCSPLPEPLSDATLTVIPNLSEISEGDHLYLICGVKGSPPITFKWYRSGQAAPVHTTTANMNHTDFQVPLLSKDHSGKYHCEAINYANFIHSEPVIIVGETPQQLQTLSSMTFQRLNQLQETRVPSSKCLTSSARLMLMSNNELVAPC